MSDTSTPLIHPPDSRRNRLIAIAMTCGAVIGFTMIDACAKGLAPRIGVAPATWLRYAAATVIILAFLNPWRVPNLLKSERPGLQTLRALLLLASTFLNFIALQYLQLAQTMSIAFLSPLLFSLLAGPVLGEWAGPRRLAAIAVGLVGVLIITRPGFGVIHPAAFLTLTGVCCYTCVLLVTRDLSARDSAETTMFYSTIAGVVLLAPFAFWHWKSPAALTDWLLVLGCGIGASIGHWLMIQAQRRAPGPILAPFIYTQIVWMSLSGYVFFDEVPDRWTWIGGSVVIASGLYLLHRERVRKVAPRPVQ